jgi:raffinose/stachyose/melibiose transport system substrate-binding protein
MKKSVKRVLSLTIILCMMFTMGLFSITSFAKTTKQKPITLNVWHIWPTGTNKTIIDTFIKKYEKDNNVIIKTEATQADEYQQRKLKVAISGGTVADVFYTYGAGYSAPFIAAKAALPLDSFIAKTKMNDRIIKGMTNYLTYNNKVYGFPVKFWAGALFCNTKLFKDNNLQIPKTFDELLAVVKAFRAKNITPMVLGAKDAWHIGMIQNALAVRTAGADYCNKALSGKASLNTPEIVKSAQMLVDLNNAGAFVKGTLGVSSDEAQMDFFMGKVPMYFGGSWLPVNFESSENQVKGLVKAVPMPTVTGGKGGVDQFLGGCIEGYMVSSKTKYPEEAIKFAAALAEYQSVEGYKLGDGVACYKNNVDPAKMNPVLAQVMQLTNKATGFVLAWDTFLQGAAIDTHYNLLQGLIGGTVTPAEFAKQMQDANAASIKASAGK